MFLQAEALEQAICWCAALTMCHVYPIASLVALQVTLKSEGNSPADLQGGATVLPAVCALQCAAKDNRRAAC